MKKISEHSALAGIAGALLLTFALTILACGSPTHWVRVKALTSDCDGPVNLHIIHDPDPRVSEIRIDDKFVDSPSARKISFLRDDTKYVQIGFSSGVVCRFIGNEPKGECTTNASSQVKAACSATLRLVEFNAPSHPESSTDAERIPKVDAADGV